MPQLKPTRGICLNRSHPLSRGLVGLWLFNEGSGNKVFDLSGNGNTGTFAGNTVWVPGKFGSALSFDGTTDYVGVGSNSILILSGSNLSIVASIKTSDIGNRLIFGAYQPSNPYSGYAFRINASKLGYFSSAFGSWVEANSSYADGVQHIVAFSLNGTSCSFYRDGVFDGTQTSAAPASYTGNKAIGARNDGNYSFLGTIDFIMIFNRVLSASEIAQLYREPFCMFEEAMRPKLISGQIVNLAGSSVALSYSSATAKAMRKVGGDVAGTSDITALLNLIRSLLNIERNWLREALFNGMTANAYKLGTTLSLGWFWVRVAGCSVLYRGSDMDEIDFVNILAVAEQDACDISPPSYIPHNCSSAYFYVIRRFNNCGYQERTLAASVKVSIESNGNLAEPQPNNISGSKVEQVDGNKIQLVWFYCPLEQKSQPMCFNVYYDGRTGQIDYENPLASIGYKGRKFYGYKYGALEAGRYLFAIRTEDAGGIESSSLARLRIQFDTTNPNEIDILSDEAV
ncbi:MAG: LamG domain-containing protein [Sedimentisphaerales bacterium]|jgi:hypothetical protein